jgi:hypothetical protein
MILCTLSLRAQQANFFSRSEIGFHAGAMFYIGDLNQFRPYYKSNLAAGFMYRFNVHSRLTLRFTGVHGKVEAYDRDATQALMVNRNLSFQSPISELAGGVEFHYFPFQFGNKRYKGTSYIIAQLGVFKMNPQTEYNGELVDLQPLGTEGQNEYSGQSNYLKYQICMPLGLGLKISLGKFASFNVEVAIRKTFTDYIDDVGSDTYYDPVALSAMNGTDAVALSNRSLDGSSFGRRGNSSNKDWYVYTGGTITFRLGKGNNCPVIR